MKRVIALGMMIFMLLSSAAVFAEDTHDEEDAIFDVIAARPVGFVTLSIGTAFFIASLPFDIISGSTDKAEKALVADPFNYTFTRQVGDFDNSILPISGQDHKKKDSPE